MIRSFASEGYRPGAIHRLLRIHRCTAWRHSRSARVRVKTYLLVRAAWERLDAPDVKLDAQQESIAKLMMKDLGLGLFSDAQAWQDVKERESDDYYSKDVAHVTKFDG